MRHVGSWDFCSPFNLLKPRSFREPLAPWPGHCPINVRGLVAPSLIFHVFQNFLLSPMTLPIDARLSTLVTFCQWIHWKKSLKIATKIDIRSLWKWKHHFWISCTLYMALWKHFNGTGETGLKGNWKCGQNVTNFYLHCQVEHNYTLSNDALFASKYL